jgi:hypothetical protein
MARNAIMLGIIAGVCSRHEQAKSVLAEKKTDYFNFFTREIVGSRSPVPHHTATGLTDFFLDFVTIEDLNKDVIPPIEKGLLRAPEVVLDLVPALVKSLPEDIDLSSILSGHFMKPLLSNVKSSNPAIRQSVLNTFKAATARSHDVKILEQVADEILGPLKSGKLASADQRVLHSEMLVNLPLSSPIASKVTSYLLPVVGKEGNEAALAAEVAAVSYAVLYELQQGRDLSKPVIDGFTKGLADKKVTARRIWILKVGEILANFNATSQPIPTNVSTLAESVSAPLADTWAEILKNPPAAVQSSLITGAYVFATLAYQTLARIESPGTKSTLKKTAVSKECLVVEPKPSFFLNHRVYGRLSTEDDSRWFLRALAATVIDLPDAGPNVRVAWSQALIYLSSSPTVSPQIRKEASETISKLYAEDPALISEAVISGLWQWVESIETADKDSIAASAKFDKNYLHVVLRSICLNGEELTKLDFHHNPDLLEKQMCSLLILSRPELIPRSSWIDTTLRVGLDPGTLARKHEEHLIQEIIKKTSFEQKVRYSPISTSDPILLTCI